MTENRKRVGVALSQQSNSVSVGVAGQQSGATVSLQAGGHIATRADTANRLFAARKIELSGGVTGSAYFDGSQDIVIANTFEQMTNADILEIMVEG